MAGHNKNNTTTALNYIASVLIAIGKPFYFILSRVLIAVMFLSYSLGHVIFLFFKLIKKIKFSIFSKRKYHKIIYPRFQLILPDLKINLHAKKFYIFLVFGLSILILISYSLIFKDLPLPNELTTRQVDVSTKIYDRNGTLLYSIYKDKNRTLVQLSNVPKYLILATLAAEDAEFYTHSGFSIKGMFRALKKNLSEKKLQGGSTITQQLVKNALLSSEKTYIRKVRELILAIGVENKFSKNEILEMYLNEVNYGGIAYGIQEASRQYYNKDVQELTLAESALLAGLPQQPTLYSPFGSNPDLTFSRQREVLYLMKVNKFITQDEEYAALNERITFAPNAQNIKAPHFVMYVREKLIENFGEEVVLRGGLSVTTTLDLNVQKLAEDAVVRELDKLSKLNVTNGAVVITNPLNGEILAMVGSKDYFDIKNGGNVNVTTRLRQPGSSIKVVNYALGLSNGLTLASTIDDSPITFNVQGLPPYTPKNYDNTYRGKITVRSALAESRNIPAVKLLASQGVSNMIDLGEKMGITTWSDRSRFGLSLTLGGGETKLIDLARVYGTIANYGKSEPLKEILGIKNLNGKEIYNYDETSYDNREVIDPRVSFLLINVLKDNVARAPAFGQNSMLTISNHPEVAVKTGTSNDLKDNLTIGFNQNYLVAVWVGNNDASPMSRIASGITGAAPIWNMIMTSLLKNMESKEWNIPEGLIYKECYSRYEWFLEEKQINCPKIIEPAASINLN